jgi:hypothetical protein
MDAHAVPLLAIFEKKMRLEVPLFQRQYVWNREHQWLGPALEGGEGTTGPGFQRGQERVRANGAADAFAFA